ncbi:MAG: DUF2207 domain-containing protein, partial [Propionibacteriales bacterium]|nr:DUF2207 domain-containing protein [Propionibacteriales bacterium]
MRKLVAGLFGLAVLAVIVGIGGVSFSSHASGGETSTITDYTADFTVKADGDLDVVETLTVDFPISRHGIFRFFDTRDNPNGSHSRVLPEHVSVTRDGQSEDYSRESESRARYLTLKIGRANTLLDGTHVYRIRYTIPGALSPGTNGSRTQFYWDLIPAGWQMPINQSHLTVHLPAQAHDFKCAVGVGQTSGCTAEGEGTDTLTVLTGSLAPNTPVTIRVGLDIPTPSAHMLPWSSRLDPVFGRHPVVLGGVLVLAFLAALGGFTLTRSTHEKQPAYPLMYAPPDGIGPAQAAYILTEKVD